MRAVSVAVALSGMLWAADLSAAAVSEIITMICARDCSGKMAAVYPWVDAKQVPRIYEYRGDLSACTHPPLIFLDPQGNTLLIIPEEPLNPSDLAQAARFRDLHEKRHALVKGLLRHNPVHCEAKKK